MSAATLELQGVIESVSRLVTVVQSEPLTHGQLWERWGKPETRTFQRMRDDLGLRPFTGRGETAMYRMAAVLKAEEVGEKKNGGGR
jgi:hypothetical protein